jgi:hypothetical protein
MSVGAIVSVTRVRRDTAATSDHGLLDCLELFGRDLLLELLVQQLPIIINGLEKSVAVAEGIVAQLLSFIEELLRRGAILEGFDAVSVLGDAGAAEDLGDARVVEDRLDGQLGEISVDAVRDQFPAETHCLEYLVGEWAAGDLHLRRRRGKFSLRDSSKAELVLQGQTHDLSSSRRPPRLMRRSR